jgi:hypothetical protein
VSEAGPLARRLAPLKRWSWRIALALLVLLLSVVALLWTPDTDPAAMRAKYGAAPSQFLDLGNGLRVHLRDEGPRDAPVLVLLHGSNADLLTWDGWARALTPAFRVYATIRSATA